MTEYLIWWTSQHDYERIEPPTTWPEWLAVQFDRRIGRNGRGRLWVSTEFNSDLLPEAASWNDDDWLGQIASCAGGIVIRREDLPHIQFLPGFVTTFGMALPEADRPAPGREE